MATKPTVPADAVYVPDRNNGYVSGGPPSPVNVPTNDIGMPESWNTGYVKDDHESLPDRGTTTGMTGFDTNAQGMSLDQDATNSQGKISGTGSDPMAECYADDPTFGPAAGDNDKSEGY